MKGLLKKFIVFGMVCLIVVFAAACGNGASNNAKGNGKTGGNSTSKKAPVVIKFSTWSGEVEDKQLNQIIDKINKEHKGEFQIKEYATPQNYDQKLKTELAAGTAPDIFYLGDGNAPTYAKNGVLLNLSPYLKKYKDKYTVANLDNYYSYTLKNDTYKGSYYALPWIAQPTVMYYNPKLFKEAGLQEPKEGWTWSDFLNDVRTIKQKTGTYGFLVSNGWPPITDFIWSEGGHIWNKDMTKSTFDSPGTVKALTLWHTMIDEKLVPSQSELANVSIEDLFRQGKVAMFMGGAADGNFDAKGFKAKVAILPKGTQEVTDIGISDIGINAHTKLDKDVVFKAYMALIDGIDHWKVVPPVKQYAANLGQMDIPDAPNGHLPQDRVQPILDSMKVARLYRSLDDADKMQKYWNVLANDVYEPLLLDKETPQQIAKKTQDDLNAILK